ncbi:putative ABC transporter, branched-chain amino acid-binding protein [Magnetospirillum sp. XM-1]|uniref:ABC transporter substrate-binding protein n=1 Tax=Magnetospirillum sp. XM-1 TaxID=1663591 RepID=UPI00073E0C9A|nr:ABC transporter substrate-binding protein [Magnetospirillum sp. XM-1]CUW41624.1 putative ABC transporter, branched-chain amino acid-binding protein [Magnetospirillum sp. XM-1]
MGSNGPVSRNLITLLAVGLGLAATPAPAAEPIRIGSVVSATGPASFLGDPEQKTLELLVEKVNAAGGVLGRKIELIPYDDASDTAKANTMVRRLIQQDKVDVIIGASTTGSTMGMVPVAEAAKVPMVSLAAASVIVEPVKPYVFKMPHSDRMAAQKVLEDMKKRGITNFALLSDTGGFGKSGHDETLKIAATMGMPVVEDLSYGDKDTDMTPQLTKAKLSGAKAIFVFGTGQAPAVIARNHAQLALGIPLYMSHGQASMDFVKLTGKPAEGIRMPSPALLIAENLPASDPQRAVSVEYKREFEARYKTDVSTFGGYAFDALRMVIDAIKKTGGTDKEKVRAALEQTTGFAGVSGIYNMSETDHMGLGAQSFRMVEIRNGGFAEAQ